MSEFTIAARTDDGAHSVEEEKGKKVIVMQ
jgi:hypothetical protein